MAFQAAALGASSLAIAAYVDARLLIRHDLASGSVGGRRSAMKYVKDSVKADRLLTYHVLEDQATGINANITFLIFEGKQWTYRQFFDTPQRVGNWLSNDLGMQKGEIVALNGGNSPEYLMLGFGLDAIGAVPARINYIFSATKISNILWDLVTQLSALAVQTVYYSPSTIAALSDNTPTPQSRRSGLDPAGLRSLTYTSGTTGMPKATMMPINRELPLGRGMAAYLRLTPKTRMYTCMPLYHGAAYVLCLLPTIHAGSTRKWSNFQMVLSRKFSHATFWLEVSASKATIIQYVGELGRYLVNAKPHPLERKHVVELAWGNGMRPDVWETFRERFNIPIINELYAATDGMGSTFNYNRGHFGANAIGKRCLLWNWFNQGEVRVRIDVDTEEMYRHPLTRFAQKCKLGEPGEVLHQVDPAASSAAFMGYYKNPKAGEKRFLRDVFKKGDMYFRSGDMMRQDPDGCVYFVDRLGDTFRWKSENVSTNEVGNVVGKLPQIAETNVYGVSVPHSDGRAGCAAVNLKEGLTPDTLDCSGLATWLIETLPRYAVPVFIRVVRNLEYTGTMKVQKGKYKAEGVDPEKTGKTGDKLFWLPMGEREYVPLRKTDWDRLGNKSLKL